MEICKSNTLTEEQNKEIQKLEQICYQKENLENHLFLSNEINYDRSVPVFYMAYEEDSLIGFLTIFIPTREEAEISAIVHPDYQRKGVFTKLDRIAREVIEEHKIDRIVYAVEAKSKSAHEVLNRWNITRIQRSEYRMKMSKEQIIKDSQTYHENPSFKLKRVSENSIQEYLEISNKAFGEEEDSGFADTLMNSDSRKGYSFFKDDKIIGTVAIGLEEKDPFIYGVAIDQKERGKGYAKYLMEQACLIGIESGDMLQLDVDSQNPVAFHLYQNMGFEITFQVDYYER